MKKVEWGDFVTECIEYEIPLSAAKAANAVWANLMVFLFFNGSDVRAVTLFQQVMTLFSSFFSLATIRVDQLVTIMGKNS